MEQFKLLSLLLMRTHCLAHPHLLPVVNFALEMALFSTLQKKKLVIHLQSHLLTIYLALFKHGMTPWITGILTNVFYTFKDSLLPSFTGEKYIYMGKKDNGRAFKIDGLIGRSVFYLLS